MDTYEKKYKESMAKMSTFLAKYDGFTISKDGEMYKELSEIFPELKESEDEKIRKAIHIYLDWLDGRKDYAPKGKYTIRDMIAWLEKQGEQKQDPCDNCDDKRLNCHNFPCVKKKAFEQGKSVFDIINEEKVDNANKVEHKFNEGDWVVNRENKIGQIKALKKDKYNVLRYCIEWKDGKKTNPIQYYADNYCHLWTLSDAKDGDVLNSQSHHLIWIYKDNEHFYACVNMNYVTENVATDGLIKIPSDACPATKEQREQLEKAMTDAGYIFDFEKKELKKIVAPKFKIGDTMRTLQEASNGITSGLPVIVSIDNEYYHCNNELIAIKDQDEYEYPPMNRRQKPAWSEEDENLLKISVENLTELKDRFGKDYGRVGDCISWLKSLEERVQPQPKQKCSEWDRSKIQRICKYLEEAKKYYADITEVRECIEWLKFLRPQYIWQPSDEQMKAFENFVRGIWESCYDSPYENNAKLLYSLLSDLKKLK